MIGLATNRLAAWSVCTYALILYVYPCAFRREFGDAMTRADPVSCRPDGATPAMEIDRARQRSVDMLLRGR